MGLDTDFGSASALGPEPPQRTDRRRAADAQMEVLRDYIKRNIEQTQELIERANKRDTELHELRAELAENTRITAQVRELLDAMRAGLRVIGWLGKAAKWGGALAAAGTALYTAYHMATHGGRPPGT